MAGDSSIIILKYILKTLTDANFFEGYCTIVQIIKFNNLGFPFNFI